MPDYRLNSRSPYYIDGLISVTENPPPDPIEENTPPTVTITASNETPYVGQTVTLTAVATDSDGTIVSYQWSTGSTSTQIEPTSSSEGCIDFNVVVTDDDGDTANATKRICWQKVPEIITNPTEKEVKCGDTVNAGQFTGELVYRITDVGDKVGDVEIAMVEGLSEVQDVPVKFTLEWDGNTSTTDYVGSSDYDDELQARGISPSDISTATDSTKEYPTALTLNKTAATPTDVYIKATTPLINDAFSFTITCPDPADLSVPTFFYTLEGTCTTGDTTFNYTDSDGNPQQEVLANGETQLISAQEDTVSAAICTGTLLKGGESFDNGTPSQDYDRDVEINIIFDDSGSMNDTLYPLMQMAEGNLRNTLLEYYNNDEALYQRKVKIIKSSRFWSTVGTSFIREEDFFLMLAHGKVSLSSTKSIYLLFADEMRDRYMNSGSPLYSDYANGAAFRYQPDLDTYRTFLNSTNYGEYFARVFKIEGKSSPLFKVKEDEFFQNIFSGEDGFEGSKGLSDRSEVSIEQQILQEGVSYTRNPTYYYNFVVQALRDFGFNI